MKQKMPIWRKILREILRPFYQLYIKIHLHIDNSIKGNKLMSEAEIAQDKAKYTELNKDNRFVINREWDYIIRYDKYAFNGDMGDGQYFIQDIWGARRVLEHKPSVHYDVGSSVRGFIAHLLAQKQKIVLLDIRPMNNQFNTSFLSNGGGGITYFQENATLLEHIADNSIESLSALCSVEHFGLGRYGDPIEPNAWEKALKSFQRVIKPGGKLFFSVPVADEDRLCFNAHRIYKPQTIIDVLDSMQIIEMGYIQGFDVIECMKWENDSLRINQENLDSIPKAHKHSPTGLFAFVKK